MLAMPRFIDGAIDIQELLRRLGRAGRERRNGRRDRPAVRRLGEQP